MESERLSDSDTEWNLRNLNVRSDQLLAKNPLQNTQLLTKIKVANS